MDRLHLTELLLDVNISFPLSTAAAAVVVRCVYRTDVNTVQVICPVNTTTATEQHHKFNMNIKYELHLF